MRKPKAPSHLSDEATGWWEELAKEFDVSDPAGRLLLQTALESFDQMRRDQAVVDKEGSTVTDRWGQKKGHPLISSIRDARSQMLMALKQLNLDVVPTQDGPGRPPGR